MELLTFTGLLEFHATLKLCLNVKMPVSTTTRVLLLTGSLAMSGNHAGFLILLQLGQLCIVELSLTMRWTELANRACEQSVSGRIAALRSNLFLRPTLSAQFPCHGLPLRAYTLARSPFRSFVPAYPVLTNFALFSASLTLRLLASLANRSSHDSSQGEVVRLHWVATSKKRHFDESDCCCLNDFTVVYLICTPAPPKLAFPAFLAVAIVFFVYETQKNIYVCYAINSNAMICLHD